MTIEGPEEILRYCIQKGSITVDGVGETAHASLRLLRAGSARLSPNNTVRLLEPDPCSNILSIEPNNLPHLITP